MPTFIPQQPKACALSLQLLPLALIVKTGPECMRGPYSWSSDTFTQERRRYTSDKPRIQLPSVQHSALDIVASKYTPIVAPCVCRVGSAAWDKLGGWTVWLRADGDRFWWSIYMAHMAFPACVSVGDRLQPGQLIGLVGRTGKSNHVGGEHATPPHLHMSITQKERAPGSAAPSVYDGLINPAHALPFAKAVGYRRGVRGSANMHWAPQLTPHAVDSLRDAVVMAYASQMHSVGHRGVTWVNGGEGVTGPFPPVNPSSEAVVASALDDVRLETGAWS